MKQVRYIGTSNVRHLGSDDFDRLGMEGEGPLTWLGREPQQMKNESAKALVEHPAHAGEFEILDDEQETDKPPAKRSTRDRSSEGTPQS